MSPLGLAVAPEGAIYVADGGDAGSTGGVVEVDAGTGEQTLLSAGGRPTDIAVEPGGDLLVNDLAGRAVVRVSAATGARQTVSAGGRLVAPMGIAVAPTGEIYVADAGDAGSTGGVLRVDPGSGVQTVLSAGGRPTDVAYGLPGHLVVNEPASGALAVVDATTGARMPLAAGPPLIAPHGVAVADVSEPPTVPALAAAGRALLGALLLSLPLRRLRSIARGGSRNLPPPPSSLMDRCGWRPVSRSRPTDS